MAASTHTCTARCNIVLQYRISSRIYNYRLTLLTAPCPSSWNVMMSLLSRSEHVNQGLHSVIPGKLKCLTGHLSRHISHPPILWSFRQNSSVVFAGHIMISQPPTATRRGTITYITAYLTLFIKRVFLWPAPWLGTFRWFLEYCVLKMNKKYITHLLKQNWLLTTSTLNGCPWFWTLVSSSQWVPNEFGP